MGNPVGKQLKFAASKTEAELMAMADTSPEVMGVATDSNRIVFNGKGIGLTSEQEAAIEKSSKKSTVIKVSSSQMTGVSVNSSNQMEVPDVENAKVKLELSGEVSYYGSSDKDNFVGDVREISVMATYTYDNGSTEDFSVSVEDIIDNGSKVVVDVPIDTLSKTTSVRVRHNNYGTKSLTITQMLRKYFILSPEIPLTDLSINAFIDKTSHLSTSADCEVTIPAADTAAYVYIAMPARYSFSKVTLPDELGVPLNVTKVGEVTRSIAGENFVYNVYKSVGGVGAGNSRKIKVAK